MDAVKFIKEAKRMCNTYREFCKGCPNYGERCFCFRGVLPPKHAELNIERVGQWSAEHPVKTRAEVFKEMFPNSDPATHITPCFIEGTIECYKCKWNEGHCKQAHYWSEPAPEGFGKGGVK